MRQRQYYFDNAKFILAILVVLGHSLRPFTDDNDFIHSIYTWIYFFHMPAFILCSGYFAKNFNKKGHYKKLIIKLLLPYLVFSILYAAFISIVFDKEFTLDLITPYWLLWFLASLFLWQVMLLLFSKIPYSLFWVISISVLAGYIDEFGKEFSLMRTLVLFPFFFIGFKAKQEHLDFIRKPPCRAVSLLILISAFLYIHFIGGVSFRWLWASKPYSVWNMYGMEAGMYRMIYSFVMLLMTIAFLSLISNREKWYSKLGIYTMYTYLLHGFIIRLLVYKWEWIKEPDSLLNLLVLAFFVLIVCLLPMWKPIRIIAKPLIEPYSFYQKQIEKCNNRQKKL